MACSARLDGEACAEGLVFQELALLEEPLVEENEDAPPGATDCSKGFRPLVGAVPILLKEATGEEGGKVAMELVRPPYVEKDAPLDDEPPIEEDAPMDDEPPIEEDAPMVDEPPIEEDPPMEEDAPCEGA